MIVRCCGARLRASTNQGGPFEGIAAPAVKIAVSDLAGAFAIARRGLRNGIEPADNSRPMHSRLRFCTKGLKLKPHRVMHQRAGVAECPFRGGAVGARSRSSGTSAEYRRHARHRLICDKRSRAGFARSDKQRARAPAALTVRRPLILAGRRSVSRPAASSPAPTL